MGTTTERRGALAAIGGAPFVIAQIFTIASTILGVYLAGYVGFQRTLEYDQLKRAQDQLNLVAALEGELADNTTRLAAHRERMVAANEEGKPIWSGGWPELRLYVWEAAAESPTLFQLPPETIVALQSFYAETAAIVGDEKLQEHFSRLSGTNAYERNQALERFDGLLARIEGEIAPSLSATRGAAEAVVEAYRGPR